MVIPVAEMKGHTGSLPPVLTPDAMRLIGVMQRVHGHSQRGLLERRSERSKGLRRNETTVGAPGKDAIAKGGWKVAPAPDDLCNRRVEITGPVDRKMMISALNSGADVFMADLEDSLSPTWANIVEGHANLRDAAEGTLSFERPDGTIDRPVDSPATLAVRPRGLHLLESHVTIDGRSVSAALFDATLVAHNCARALSAQGSGLYLYLAKLEHYHEAEWWDAVLADLERRLGLPPASIKVTVLIETITAAMQMEEILYALRERVTGLNAGRWDYIFSVIKRLGYDPDHVLPDRHLITMSTPFMAAYAERLVAICHRRGAHAIGGMAAFVPNRKRPDTTENAIRQVRSDKEREARLGYDGTWVAHPDLVPVAEEVFSASFEGPHQLDAQVSPEPSLDKLLETSIASGEVTVNGIDENIDVSLRYLEAWLAGTGAVAINDLMEDAATVEISRSQLWQWLYHAVTLSDGKPITAELVASRIDNIAADLSTVLDPQRLKIAGELLRDAVFADELPEFLTVLAEAYLP